MPLQQNHVGFHITSSKLRLVEVNYEANEFYLGNVDEEYFSEFLDFSFKETKFINILQTAFNELILRKPLTTDVVSFCLPNQAFKIYELPYEESLVKSDMLEHLKWELSILCPAETEVEYSTGFFKIFNGNIRKEKSLILLGIAKKYLMTIHKFCERNNLKLKFVDNEHVAANNVVKMNFKLDAPNVYLSLLVQESYFSVLVTEGSEPIYFTTKIFNRADELLETLTYEMDRISNLSDTTFIIKESYLVGDQLTEGLIEKIQDNTGLRLKSVNPFTYIQNSSRTPNNEMLQKKNVVFNASAGIAYRVV